MNSPHVVLVGPPGAGKTTIGRRLSRALNCDVVDTDSLIEARYGKKCGEIFSELGEPEFREVEAEVVREALATTGVVSLGGGAVLTESTRDLLDSLTVVYLDITPEEGVTRTMGGTSRPILESADPLARYSQLLEERRPLYTKVADLKVRTGVRSPQQVVGDILSFLETL
ncbi:MULTISPECIES: shikimate kinase [Corynebacterium]|uniref:Shikimate kinase n=1 Tax=Corynebacterium aurimucosum TaxID=169292 RepID=A0A2N6TIL6_9CORY|nr:MULTISPECIES: shikimate kinase [Corynebacterium]OFK68485.1 shikimate kinase [Corynebacterium sp. HMSC076G08]OFO18862.1 shikimate kinase [Corynebacterium sp. HMSC056F09]OFP31681.1 shikimate kinase [Corynebacterium sp. HMSC068G04]PMC69158.1 shikimate kinase [Corynebacterium aurimucosum]TVU85226.1 shikimate kinase [Corynebacterium aurimucosum]